MDFNITKYGNLMSPKVWQGCPLSPVPPHVELIIMVQYGSIPCKILGQVWRDALKKSGYASMLHQESGILLKCTYVDLNFLKSLKSSEIQ